MAEFRVQVVVDPSRATTGSRRVKRELEGVENSADRVRASLLRMAALLGGGALFGRAIQQTARFQTSIAEISTLVDRAVFDIERLQRAALEQAGAFGQDPRQQAQALYQIISAGAADSAEAITLLNAANRLAIAGVTEVSVAADGLTSVLNAYQLSASSAADISDILFVGVRAGKTTIDELSASLGRVAPVAAGVGVEFDELTAAVAALTASGVSTNEAVTGIRAVLNAIIRPTAEAAKFAEQLGIEFNASALESRGLAGVLQDVRQATGGSAQGVSQLFTAIEAFTPALSLVNGAGETFAQTLDDMTGRAGATEEAFRLVSDTFEFQFNRVLREAETTIQAGLIPVLNALTPVLRAVADNFDLIVIAATTFAGVLVTRLAAPVIAAAMVALRAQVLAIGLALQTGTLSAVAFGSALGALRGVFAFLLANPLGALVVAIGAAVAIMSRLESASERVARINQEIERTANDIRAAYDLAEGSADDFRRELESISRTQALVTQSEAVDVFSERVNELGLRLDAVDRFFTVDRTDQGLVESFRTIVRDLEATNITLDEARQRIDAFGAAAPESLRPVINGLIGVFDESINARDELERAVATIRVLDGTASDADRALLGLSNSANTAAGAANNLQSAAAGALAPLQQLQNLIPAIAEAQRVQAQVAQADAALSAGLESARARARTGDLSVAEQAAEVRTLRDTYSQAIDEVTGVADATRDAAEALTDYTDRASLDALQGQARAVEQATREYNGLREQLIATGASQQQLDQLQSSFNQQLETINRNFQETGGGGGSIAQTNEQLERLKNLQNEVTGGSAGLIQRQNDLQTLFSEGRIGVEAFNQQMRSLNLQFLELSLNQGTATFADTFLLQLGRMTEGITNFRADAGLVFGDFFQTFTDGFADSVGRAIVQSEDLGEALSNVASQALTQLVSGLIKLGIQYIVNAAIGRSVAAASSAASAAQAAGVAAAWAPAAALSALATGGANAAGANAAIAGTVASARTAAVVGAFQDGGPIIGQGGPRQDNLLAFVSNGEHIMNAQAARRNRPLLDAMNRGADVMRMIPRFQTGGAITPTQLIQRTTQSAETQERQRETQSTNIINVLDPSLVGQYLQGSDGRQAVVNILSEEGVI